MNGDLPVLGMVLTVSVLVIDCVDEETGSKIADKKAAGFISYYCNATNELGSDSQITVVVRANVRFTEWAEFLTDSTKGCKLRSFSTEIKLLKRKLKFSPKFC
jgi:hypothetical protein